MRAKWSGLRKKIGRAAKGVRQAVMQRIAKAARRRTSAKVIAVTGSSGKSTTASLITHILEATGTVRSQLINNALQQAVRALVKPLGDARFVVVECGTDKKGSMRALAAFLEPDVAVVTLVGNEHYSAFRGKEGVAEEKAELVAAVRPGGFVLLNADDAHVAAMASRTGARVVTFGLSESATYRIVHHELGTDGLRVTVTGPTGTLALRTRLLAPFFAWNVAAACACALELGVPAEAIVERVASFSPVPGRFELVRTADGPTFILDTVKAPFYTLGLAISAFGALPAKRKRIVIGQISDSKAPKKTYRDAYKVAREAADQVLMVGDWSHRSQAGEEDIASGRFHAFQEPVDVFRLLRDIATPDDLILLKGSTNQHLERIALAWDEDVRCWKGVCGLSTPCRTCGLYAHPFESHKRLRRQAKRRKQLSKLVQWLPSIGSGTRS